MRRIINIQTIYESIGGTPALQYGDSTAHGKVFFFTKINKFMLYFVLNLCYKVSWKMCSLTLDISGICHLVNIGISRISVEYQYAKI